MTRAYFLALVVTLCSTARADEGDQNLKFKDLFNGKDFTGWVPVNVAPNTFTVKDGVIHSTGTPTGVMRTERQYENFVIELDWMHEKPAGNAGLFVWGAPMTAPGTPFAKGIEVQILDEAYVQGEAKEKHLYTGQGDIFSIHGASMKPDRPHPAGWERCLPSENRTNPAGQWNHYRVEANDGVIKLAVNGKVVSGGSQCRPRKGYLCLESEGSPAQFKNIRIAELPSTNPKPEECQPEAEGFTSLYTGVDLSNWTGDKGYQGNWKPGDWVLHYDGKSQRGDSVIRTEKSYTNFEFIVDWRFPPMKPEPQVARYGGIKIGAPDKVVIPLSVPAGEQPGKWNRTVVTVNDKQFTVHVNGKEPNSSGGKLPDKATSAAPVQLLGGPGDTIEFANIFIRELK
jgi:hypothetical protein